MRLLKTAAANDSTRVEVFPDPSADARRVHHGNGLLPRALQAWSGPDGLLRRGTVKLRQEVNMPPRRAGEFCGAVGYKDFASDGAPERGSVIRSGFAGSEGLDYPMT